MNWTDILITLFLMVGCTVAIMLTVLRLPGTWLIAIIAIGMGWQSQWNRPGVWAIGSIVTLAIVGEIVELLSSVVLARKAGASRQAAWGGLIGGMLGMFFLSVIPIPIISSVIGALLGCFLGAALVEMVVRNRVAQGARVGLFSAMGFVLGTVLKLSIAMAMSAALLTSVLCRTNHETHLVRTADPTRSHYRLSSGGSMVCN